MTRGAALVAALALVLGCGDSTGPIISDVQLARAAWVQAQPANYTFEVSFVSEWIQRTGYYRITVENGVAVSMHDASGAEAPHTIIPTIEDYWESILEASQDGALKRGEFTVTGVPVEWYIDRDAWADDAHGAWIRNFRKR
jgi:hypothetical protein